MLAIVLDLLSSKSAVSYSGSERARETFGLTYHTSLEIIVDWFMCVKSISKLSCQAANAVY